METEQGRVRIVVPFNQVDYLQQLCDAHHLTSVDSLHRNILSDDIRFALDIPSVVIVVASGSAFWIALRSVLTALIRRTSIEIELEMNDTKIKLKAGHKKDIDKVIESMSKVLNQGQNQKISATPPQETREISGDDKSIPKKQLPEDCIISEQAESSSD